MAKKCVGTPEDNMIDGIIKRGQSAGGLGGQKLYEIPGGSVVMAKPGDEREKIREALSSLGRAVAT